MNIILSFKYISNFFFKKVKHGQENCVVCCEGSLKFSHVTKSSGWYWFNKHEVSVNRVTVPGFRSYVLAHLCGTRLNSPKGKADLDSPAPWWRLESLRSRKDDTQR